MKKLNFLIIGPKTENTKDLGRAIKKSKNYFKVSNLSKIYLKFSDGKAKIGIGKKNVKSFDIFIFRGFNKNTTFAQILAKELLAMGKTVIDEKIGRGIIFSKVYEASVFSRNSINHPKTLQILNSETILGILNDFIFPVVVKPIDGQKGQGIKKLNTKKELVTFFKDDPHNYLVQEFIPADGDIRIFVVGNKVLGGIKRFKVSGDFRSNASLGAKAIKIMPDTKMKRIALKVAKLMGYEIAGVDIIVSKNKYYVLEVNHSPQWQRFKEATGINPADYIIDYAIKKYEKNKSRIF